MKLIASPVVSARRVGRTVLLLLVAIGGRTTDAGAAESMLLTGAVVHCVSGPVMRPGQVLVRDGKIAALGEHLAADQAKVVDLSGHHLYPGLIAATTLLGLTEIGAIRATHDTTEVGQFAPDVRSWIAVNPDSELIPVARANGICLIAPTPQGGAVAGQSGLVALDGWTMEQMAVRKPIALHINWPNMNLDLTPKAQFKDPSKWKSPEDLAKDRRKQLLELERFFQEAEAYRRARETTPTTLLNPPWEAMRPYLQGRLPVMVHADDFRAIEAAVRWGHTNHYRLVIAGARDAAEAASLLASNNVPVIFEHVFDRGLRDTESYDSMFRTAAVLHQAGVLVALSAGTDDKNETEVRNLPYHAAQSVAFGLSPDEAIKSITLNPARILGVEDQFGSIEVGKSATMFATNGDLLDIRSNVHYLWIAGRSISLETRQTRLYEKYRHRPTTP